jgi:nucleotide-binding universal stress UspA family protein
VNIRRHYGATVADYLGATGASVRDVTDARVFRLVVAGYDGSPGSQDALALAALLAQPGSSLVAARVFAPPPRLLTGGAADLWLDHHADEQRTQVAELEQAARAAGATPERIVARSPEAGLHDLAGELEADLIVVGSAHVGPEGVISAGPVAERLLHGSPCAVAIAPRGFKDRGQDLRVIGVGYDGSPEASVALDGAIRLGLAHETTMRVFTVAPKLDVPPGTRVGADPHPALALRAAYEAAAREAEERTPDELRAATKLATGAPAAVLLEQSQMGLDLLAVGSRAFGPFRRTFSGSVATALMHGLACPLLVFPRGSHPAEPLERLPAPEEEPV